MLQQHHSACSLIAAGERPHLVRPYARGERTCGVAFAHVRGEGEQPVRVRRVRGGLEFAGRAPWFSGAGQFEDIVIAGCFADGRIGYGLIGAHEAEILPPLRLMVMQASSTAPIVLDRVLVPRDRVLMTWTRAEQLAADARGLLRVGAQCAGVTRAAIDLLRGVATANDDAAADAAADAFDAELARLRRAFGAVAGQELGDEALVVRAAATELGVRATQAALAAVGGGGLRLGQRAQRLCREALFLTVTITSPRVRRGILAYAAARARGA